MDAEQLDRMVRLAAFTFLTEQVDRHGDVLPLDVLRRGFQFLAERYETFRAAG